MKKHGKVISYNARKGWGFIASEGKDYFAHWKEIESPLQYKVLDPGQLVSFTVGKNHKGLYAANIEIIPALTAQQVKISSAGRA